MVNLYSINAFNSLNYRHHSTYNSMGMLSSAMFNWVLYTLNSFCCVVFFKFLLPIIGLPVSPAIQETKRMSREIFLLKSIAGEVECVYKFGRWRPDFPLQHVRSVYHTIFPHCIFWDNVLGIHYGQFETKSLGICLWNLLSGTHNRSLPFLI